MDTSESGIRKADPRWLVVCGDANFATDIDAIPLDRMKRALCIGRLPCACAGCGIAQTADGHVVVAGGRAVDGSATRNAWAYVTASLVDEARSHASQSMPMTEARDAPAVAAVGNRVYVIGGCDGDRVSGTCEVATVAVGVWSPGPPMPTARCDAAVAVVGRRIYVIGGSGAAADMATVEALDTESGTWTSLAPLPTARRGAMAVTIGERFIWVLGGEPHDQTTAIVLNPIEVLDTETGEWSHPPIGMPTLGRGACAVAVGHSIHLIGGLAPWTYKSIATVHVLDTDALSWTEGSPMPVGRSYFAAIGI